MEVSYAPQDAVKINQAHPSERVDSAFNDITSHHRCNRRVAQFIINIAAFWASCVAPSRRRTE